MDKVVERYAPFYCEENVWWLAQAPGLRHLRRVVVFIANPQRACALWGQRAGALEEGGLVIWDYHVVLWVQGDATAEVWDLDAVGGCPMSGAQWTQATFPSPERTQRRFWPWFRLVEADVFVRDFRSDRSHMRGQGGEWQKPPPPWAAPCGEGERSNLWDYAVITEEQARAARRGGGAQGRGEVLGWEGWGRLNGL